MNGPLSRSRDEYQMFRHRQNAAYHFKVLMSPCHEETSKSNHRQTVRVVASENFKSNHFTSKKKTKIALNSTGRPVGWLSLNFF